MDGERKPAAERLLEAAARLFYTRGVPNVGINEIIAKANVARMTLYHHFSSKEELVKAVLERRLEERSEWLAGADDLAAAPKARVLAVFDLLVAWAAEPDFRGDPLVATTFELGGQLNAARPYAQQHLDSVRAYFVRNLTEAGVSDSQGVADQLALLFVGAAVAALVDGAPTAARSARQAAELLMDAR